MNNLFPKPKLPVRTVRDAVEDLQDRQVESNLNKNGLELWYKTPVGKAGNHNYTNKYFNTKKLNPDKPSNTITSTSSDHHYGFFHWKYPRAISITEMKRLCSFPDEYDLIFPKYEDNARILGNAVPPLMMAAIAGHIRTLLQPNFIPFDTSRTDIDYSTLLSEAWKQAHQPRKHSAPTVISLFAGGGGSSLGYAIQGYRELLAVEWDDKASAVLKKNMPGINVYTDDINELTDDMMLEMTQIKPGQLDILDGSPPCQGFSMAGKRNENDPRNKLYEQYIRIVKLLEPKMLIMENVVGLIQGEMKKVYNIIINDIRALGYEAKGKIIQAEYLGVPQRRHRVIIIAKRNDLQI